MAQWQRRVSYAPSAVTVPICSPPGDLVGQFRQDRAVAVAAGGELHRPDVRRGGVHRQMHLAPLAAALRPMLSGLPFAVAEEFDPPRRFSRTGGVHRLAVHEQVQGAIGAPAGDLWTASVFCRRHRVE